MSNVQVLDKTFIKDNGEAVKYKVVAITGYLDGLAHTLELKASKTELMLAEILLASTGKPAKSSMKKIDKDEEDDFLDAIERVNNQ
jgi:hypothetical protein